LKGRSTDLLLRKKGSDFTDTRGISDNKNEQLALTRKHSGATHDDWRWDLMFVSRIFLPIFFELLFFIYAVFKDIFMNGVDLTCHCALVCCYLVRLEQNSVGWNFHAFVDLNNITYQNKILMNFNQFAISDH
jgi:hypothetical protein